jgi:hypothetical protein
MRTRNSSVGIVLGYSLNDLGTEVLFLVGTKIFLFSTPSIRALDMLAVQLVPETFSLVVNLSGCEANPSPK